MYKRILHATDLQQDHFALCEKAKKLADYHHAMLYLIHVIEIPQTVLLAQNLGLAGLITPAKEDAFTVLKTVADALKLPEKHLYVEIGSVSYHILEQAEALKADLIIMGRHAGMPTPFGSTTYHVMQHANCDVLTLGASQHGVNA